MAYIALGALGFLVIHLFDLASLNRLPLLKPIIWVSGSGLLVYAVLMVCLSPHRLSLPYWSNWLGWLLLAASLWLLIYPLFINLPLVKTYIRRGISERLVKSGLYALVRHPGVFGFVLVMIALFMVSGSELLLVAAPIWIAVDIALVVIQDRFIFVRMFPGYREYQKEVPMLVPSRGSIANFIKQLKQEETGEQK